VAKKKKKAEQSSNEIIEVQVIRLSPVFTARFKEDLGWWYKTDSKKASKIFDLITAIMAEPFTGVGKPEALKYLEENFWSRRIDLEHRLIYVVNHEQIIFYACRYHYE
jgi:toxin YoeB